MKKIIAVSIISVLVLTMGVIAYAESNDSIPQWFEDMIQWKKEQIEKAIAEETITEEQGKLLNERLDAMVEFHEKNGFDYPGGCFSGSKAGFRRSGRGFGRPGHGIRWRNPVSNQEE